MKMIILLEVEALIETLEKPTRAKWVHHVGLLELYGMRLGMPHARRINNTFSELRIRGKQEVRAFFTSRGDKIVILHAFVKKTQKLPQREVDVAQKRLKYLTGL